MTEESDFYNQYYYYLCDLVGIENGYDKVLELLYMEPFISLIPNDDNRIEDGLAIRKKFAYGMGSDTVPYNGPCSVFEMLVALADRMAYLILDPIRGKATEPNEIFWIFIKNLTLRPGSPKNRTIIKKFVKREYRYDGYGGVFPILNPTEDQTRIEIWYQMMAYLDSHYFNT